MSTDRDLNGIPDDVPNDETEGLMEQSASTTSTVEVIDALTEYAVPGTEPVLRSVPFNETEHNAKTRRTLAFGAVGVLVAFYGATFIGFWVEAFTINEVTALIASFSVVQTLVAAAFGYYFAKDK